MVNTLNVMQRQNIVMKVISNGMRLTNQAMLSQ